MPVRTSYVYHQVSAVVSLLGTIAFLVYLFKGKLLREGKWRELYMGLLIVAIAWGVHGLLHFAEEYMYNYDPLQGRTEMLKEPIRS